MRQLIIHLLGVCFFICFSITQGSSRSDIGECNWTPSHCGVKSTFSSSSRNYTRPCQLGYKHVNRTCWRVGFPPSCTDVDECSQSPSPCGSNSFCNNTLGSFTCQCHPGYSSPNGMSWKPDDPHPWNCTDVDECSQSPSPCGSNSFCNNTLGSFTCQCHPGYSSPNGMSWKPDDPHPWNCTDVDECSQSPSPCGSNSFCNNTLGSFTCQCHPGYSSPNGMSWKPDDPHPWNCTDVDECSQSPSPCGSNSFCNNTPGSFSCQCNLGYSSPNGMSWKPDDPHPWNCTDVDECSQSPSPCGSNSFCNNTPGSFSCQCNLGYSSPNGMSWKPDDPHPWNCTDVDECSQSPSCCGSYSFCTNTPGSFSCQCNLGYSSPNGMSWKPDDPHPWNCTGKSRGCHRTTLGGVSLEDTCTATSPNESSKRCKFWNKITESVKSAWGNGNGSQKAALENISTAFNELSQSNDVLAVTTFMQGVENVAWAIALNSKNETQNVTIKNMTIRTERCAGKEIVELKTEEELINFDCTTKIDNTQGPRAVAFISYASLASVLNANLVSPSDFTGGDAPCHVELNSKVVSVITGKHGNLSEPFNFTLKHKQSKTTEDKTTCIYWKNNTWSPEGCNLLLANSTHTTCTCNHLSTFAILMASFKLQDNWLLTVITYVGLTISLICLLLAILTFLLCRSIHSISTSIHLQLCLCLFLADLLFLKGMKGDSKSEVTVVCAVTAGFLHYLFLACFTWMLLEGLHLFLTVRNLQTVNYTSANRLKKRYMYPFGYGFPALVVAISAVVNHKGYGTLNHCWLSVEHGFIWSFMGPVCFIIVINLSFFVTILWILKHTLSSLNTNVSTVKNTRLLTFKAIAQLFILGCTWGLGLLQTNSTDMVMAYLFTIINSLQGFFIFLVHCLLNQQVREQYKKWIRRAGKPSIKYQSSGMYMLTAHTNTRVENDATLSSMTVPTVSVIPWEKTSGKIETTVCGEK